MYIVTYIVLILLILLVYICRHILHGYYFMKKYQIKTDGFLSYIYLYKEIFIEKCYDFPISDGMVIFDVGANIGLFNLYMNSFKKDIQIYSFEPVPQIFRYLQDNIPKNQNNIAIDKGLGHREERVKMNYIKNASSLSSMNPFDTKKMKAHDYIYEEECGIFKGVCKSLLESEMKKPIEISVNITTLSNIIDQYNINKIDLLKIDVEGNELNVIKGIRPEHFNKIKYMIIEIENYREGNRDEILSILNKYGFKIDNEIQDDNWIVLHVISTNNTTSESFRLN